MVHGTYVHMDLIEWLTLLRVISKAITGGIMIKMTFALKISMFSQNNTLLLVTHETLQWMPASCHFPSHDYLRMLGYRSKETAKEALS